MYARAARTGMLFLHCECDEESKKSVGKIKKEKKERESKERGKRCNM